MTDKEIVQVLRVCASGEAEDCPFTAVAGCDGCPKVSADLIERLTAENAALRAQIPQWISVEERLPEPETDVLIVCNRNGYVFVTPAIYEDGKMLTQESAWNWSDIYEYGSYSEEDDDYYIPEGWWESRKFNPDDVYNNPVDCTVTHWMSFPEAPEEIKSAFMTDALIKLAAQALETTPDELRGMAKARKDGRLAILPTARGDMLTSEEVSAEQPFFDDVDVSVHYCTSNGMMIFVGYDAFRDWVKNWEIAAANKEAERAMEGQKND